MPNQKSPSDERTSSENYYRHDSTSGSASHTYLWPPVLRLLEQHAAALSSRAVFEVGIGSGALMRQLEARGFDVTGVDSSPEGIAVARSLSPTSKAFLGSCYDDLAATYGTFDLVVSVEVVEHLFSPRAFVLVLKDLVKPGGIVIATTPYHGYLKNLALAFSGKWDAHFTALWEHGHIKFWSPKTLSALFRDGGFDVLEVLRVGRIPPLAKSMILVARNTTS